MGEAAGSEKTGYDRKQYTLARRSNSSTLAWRFGSSTGGCSEPNSPLIQSVIEIAVLLLRPALAMQLSRLSRIQQSSVPLQNVQLNRPAHTAHDVCGKRSRSSGAYAPDFVGCQYVRDEV